MPKKFPSLDRCNEPMVRQKDARILREALAWLHRHSPPRIQHRINTAMLDYAKQVGKYCTCPEKSFIEKEAAFACLDCGHRHKKADGQRIKVLNK